MASRVARVVFGWWCALTAARARGLLAAAWLVASAPAPALAQQDLESFEGRPIASLEFRGLERVTRQLIENQIRVSAGTPLSVAAVREDLRRLERLGEFRGIDALAAPGPNRSVNLVYAFDEAPIVLDVQVTGNRAVTDQELASVVGDTAILISDVPIDDYRIGQAKRAIERFYRQKGYYQVQVDVDESELEVDGTVIFVIREGPKVDVTEVEFEVQEVRLEGVRRDFDTRIRRELQTKRSRLFRRGVLDDRLLDQDVGTVLRIYRDEAFLDARASHRVQFSTDGREAIVTFVIEEGPRYTLRRVRAFGASGPDGPTPLRVFTPSQIEGLLGVKPGALYKDAEVAGAVETVEDAYRKQGYVDVVVRRFERRDSTLAVVDLELEIDEGGRFRTGVARIIGNPTTKASVIRRELDVQPDRWLDGAALAESERRIRNLGIFNPAEVSLAVQPEDPAYPGYRDVLVRVGETNTASLAFGAAINSDSGLAGGISLSQRNFDLFDTPDSAGEFFRGEAFKGAGQRFNLRAFPGTEVSEYGVSLTDPRVLDTRYGLSGSFQFRERIFGDYDEQRLGGRLALTRRFGSRWSGGVFARGARVELTDIEDDAPVDVFEVEDANIVTGLGFELARTSVDSRFRPTRGARTEASVEQVGALGGDFDFTRLGAEHRVFLPLYEDVLGRTTVLSLEGRVGWIVQDDEAPIYERLYLGGASFRGFDFRGIGPLGVRNDTGTIGNEHVGGEWSFFAGVQLEQPLFEELLSGVVFVDTGTLTNDPGFEDYRVSVGVGARIYVPQLSPAPLAFDFGFPIVSEDGDSTRLLTFTVDLPF